MFPKVWVPWVTTSIYELAMVLVCSRANAIRLARAVRLCGKFMVSSMASSASTVCTGVVVANEQERDRGGVQMLAQGVNRLITLFAIHKGSINLD